MEPNSAPAADPAAARDANNFNALRFGAAALVILSHGIELPTGLNARDWAFTFSSQPFSWYAVNLFFVISGFLVALSWQRRSHLGVFAKARLLRIMPGLVVMLVLTTTILGLFFSSLPFLEYISSGQTAGYVFGSASIVFVQYLLPGVFDGNPLPLVNGSLWTLRYEVFCYAALALVGYAGLLRTDRTRRIVVLTGIGMSAVVLLALDTHSDLRQGKLEMLYNLGRLGLCFLLGMLYLDLRRKIPLRFDLLLALGLVTYLTIGTPWFTITASVCTAYLAFWLAFVPELPTVFRGPHDYSYGMYIYAFPVQQAVVSVAPRASFLFIIMVSLVITLIFAVLSWHFVERPALAFKNRTASLRPKALELSKTPRG